MYKHTVIQHVQWETLSVGEAGTGGSFSSVVTRNSGLSPCRVGYLASWLCMYSAQNCWKARNLQRYLCYCALWRPLKSLDKSRTSPDFGLPSVAILSWLCRKQHSLTLRVNIHSEILCERTTITQWETLPEVASTGRHLCERGFSWLAQWSVVGVEGGSVLVVYQCFRAKPKALSAYFPSKQIPPFGFAKWSSLLNHYLCRKQKKLYLLILQVADTAFWLSRVVILPFGFAEWSFLLDHYLSVVIYCAYFCLWVTTVNMLDFRRQNVTSVDVKFWRLTSIPALYDCC